MKLQLQTIASLALIFRPASSQFVAYDVASLTAWNAYGTMVQQWMTAGHPLLQGVDYMFVTPPTTASIRGGSPCPEAVTNFDLFDCADSMQKPGEPLINLDGRSYFNSMETYLNSVNLNISDPTDAQLAHLDALTNTLATRKDKFDGEDQKACDKYAADPRINKGTFAAWVIANEPLWNVYHKEWQAADNALQQYMLQVFGPESDQLQGQRDKCGLARSPDNEPGYNMPVYPNAYTVKMNPFNAPPITTGTLTKPLYTIGNGFGDSCNAWFTSSQGISTFTWSLKDSSANNWSSAGHGSSVTQGGGSLFGILGYKSSKTNTWSNYQYFSQAFTEQISMELTMKGAPLIFNIGAGSWEVKDVRSVYPDLFSNTTAGSSTNGFDQLKNYIRLVKICVAYEVGLTIRISDTAAYKSISQFISTSTSDKGGALSLFGFHFGANSDSSYSRDVSDVSMYQTGNGGVIQIAPTPPGLTFMLGALGKMN